MRDGFRKSEFHGLCDVGEAYAKLSKTLFRFDKASSAASIAGTLSQEDFPKISKILNATSALLGLTTLGAEGWLKMKSFQTNGTIRKVLGEISKAASDASLADRVQKLNDLLTEIEALTPLQIALLKGKSNIPALSEVILKGGQELIDEGADIGRQRINDAIRILNSDMLTFLRNQLESIGANVQLIERVTILEESKAIALTLDLTDAGPDFLRAFNLDVEGGLVGAWEVIKQILPNSSTDIALLRRLSYDLDYAPDLRTLLLDNLQYGRAWESWGISFFSKADPILEVWGPGRLSHASAWNQILDDLNANGIEVAFGSPNKITYQPGPSPGQKGRIAINEDASIGALKHEYQHFLDDKAAGYRGMRGAYDINYKVLLESNAYTIEINMMKQINNQQMVNRLKTNFQEEIDSIFDLLGDQTLAPQMNSLIDQVMNL